MLIKISKILFLLLSFSLLERLYAKNIHIVTTIQPIESLIRNIIDENDSVFSLVDKNNSPHSFSLKPKQVLKLYKSNAVILINPDFETFIRSTLKIIPKNSKIIYLSDTPNLTMYPFKQYTPNSSLYDNHHEDVNDYHIWLSVHNAIQMIHYLKNELSLINPDKKNIYYENAKKTALKLLDLDTQLKNSLLAYKNQPFMVFHNAYQYFTQGYNLNLVGTITDNPSVYASIQHIKQAQDILKMNKVQCVFKEPQFSDKLIESVITDSKVNIGILDPLGSQIISDKNHYFNFMQNLVKDFLFCFDKKQ